MCLSTKKEKEKANLSQPACVPECSWVFGPRHYSSDVFWRLDLCTNNKCFISQLAPMWPQTHILQHQNVTKWKWHLILIPKPPQASFLKWRWHRRVIRVQFSMSFLCLRGHYSAYSKQCFTMCNTGNWVAVNKGVRRFWWTKGPRGPVRGPHSFIQCNVRPEKPVSTSKQVVWMNENCILMR